MFCLSSTNVLEKSGIKVEGFKNCVAKSVNVRERDGKAPLVFIELIDMDTFETTGELLLLKQDLKMDEVFKLKSLEKQAVKATLKLGTYNGRSSVNVTEMIAAN